MRLLFRLLAALCVFALAAPATARTVYYQTFVVGVPAVRAGLPSLPPLPTRSQVPPTRFVTPPPPRAQSAPETRYLSPPQARVPQVWIARYGPFRVIDEHTAELVGATDERSPAAFQAMLRDYPNLATLDFVECPGTYNDRANLSLGRMIRAAGLAAHVPARGSVRSGAVELVLAGTTLEIEDGAEFAVHAWRDEYGQEADEYSDDSYENTKYLAYYREMGMSADEAASFYAMTNSVPHATPRWLSGAEMRGWMDQEPEALPQVDVRLAYLDLSPSLN